MEMRNNKPVCKKIPKVARLTGDIPLKDHFSDLTGLSTLFLILIHFSFFPSLLLTLCTYIISPCCTEEKKKQKNKTEELFT